MQKGKISLFTLQIYLLTAICVAQNCYKYTSGYGKISHDGYFKVKLKCWRFLVPDDKYIQFNLMVKKFYDKNCSSSYVQVDIIDSGESFKYCSEEDDNPRTILTLSDINVTFVHYSTSDRNRVSFAFSYLIGSAIFAVKGVNASRENTFKWLKKQQDDSSGLGGSIHRAITALYLSENSCFRGVDAEEKLLEKKLELQTILAIIRNSSNPLLVSDLSMFINALLVTCHNPRQFFGYNLLQILSEKLTLSKFPSPAAYLTLCNAKWTLSKSDAQKLLGILLNHSAYPNHLDARSMTLMALTCLKNNMVRFDDGQNAIYNTTIEQIIHYQRLDGSFGNVYTTAVVTQALLAVNQENNNFWKLNATAKFLMQKLNSSIDYLSAYLILPILNEKTLLDISNVNCSCYKKSCFHFSNESGEIYIYQIAGITNDPEAGKYWTLHIERSNMNGYPKYFRGRIENIIVEDGDRLIMCYENVHE